MGRIKSELLVVVEVVFVPGFWGVGAACEVPILKPVIQDRVASIQLPIIELDD